MEVVERIDAEIERARTDLGKAEAKVAELSATADVDQALLAEAPRPTR